MEASRLQEIQNHFQRPLLIDLHVDILLQARLFGYDIRRAHRPWFGGQPMFLHADIPRMLEAGYTAAALGLHFWPWESKRAWREIRKQVALLERVIHADPRVFLARTAAEIREAKASGRLALLPAIEGAHILAGDLSKLDEAREWGCFYLTLAHFSRNQAATPGIGRGADETSGLTVWGRSLIRRLNELQIVVDLAHVNRQGVLDGCKISSAPVFATHTTARDLYPSRRGIDKDGLQAIAATGGVVGVIFAPNFLCGRLRATSEVVADHLAYMADAIGVEHLALGSDFDGWLPAIPSDMRDCRDIWAIPLALQRRGFSLEEIHLLLGQNVLRLLETVRPPASVPATDQGQGQGVRRAPDGSTGPLV